MNESKNQFCNHYSQLSEINSLRLACGKPPPSKREALFGSLSEGAVGVADWGSAKVVDSGFI